MFAAKRAELRVQGEASGGAAAVGDGGGAQDARLPREEPREAPAIPRRVEEVLEPTLQGDTSR